MGDVDLLEPLAAVMGEKTLSTRPRVSLMGADSPDMVARRVQSSGVTWACVDGFTQAGKSSFARKLALALGWRHVHLDHMARGIEIDSDHYADHLDHDKLLSAIDSPASVVVEGVCIRDVVESVRSTNDAANVYIARVSRPGTEALIWHDGVELERPRHDAADTDWLTRDIIAYHRRVRPHALADFVLIRVAD